MNTRAFLFSALVALFLAAIPVHAVGSFNIQINPGPGLAANTAALSAFERAAAEWEAWISSPITIYLDADLTTTVGGEPFSPTVIGSTSYTTYENFADLNLNYTTVRNAMAARSNLPGNSLLEFLPTADQISAVVPDGATFDNTTIGVLRANQRALGLLDSSDTRADAVIVFNLAYTFDYDRFDSDGVASGKTDFQTAAAHEIGHALGFMSDVDDFDNFEGLDSDNLTTLDLFRFPTAHRPTTLLEFQTFSRVLKPGVASVLADLQNAYPMSTGANQGDGNQAAHWQDDFIEENGTITIGPLVGIMDPTLPSGTSETVSASDIRAVNLIGYDIVPEPSALGLLSTASVLLLGTFRHRRGGLLHH
ncbi:NF038122 family metalloprotease [Verrucomicrobiota bacterium sgz303538]